jgi:hypothetical protein
VPRIAKFLFVLLSQPLPTDFVWIPLAQREPRRPLEPYEVPTSGHFYLHDDRTADKPENEEGEESRDVPPPKKKLWSEDGGKWKHDKFDLLDQVSFPEKSSETALRINLSSS